MIAHAILLSALSGAPQSAQAWVAVGTNSYETVFTKPLTVRVAPADTKVRFRCITAGCTFPPQVVGRADRAAPNAFDLVADDGVAALALTVRTVSIGPVVITAQAADGRGPLVRFVLTER